MILHNIEQRSPEWYQLRLGKPTASNFSNLVTPTGKPSASLKPYAVSLAAELFIGRPVDMWTGNAWTERGREMEKQAVSLYEFATDHTVTPMGFVTDDTGAFGCSPDALVNDDGMIEVKCLKAEHHISAIMNFRKFGNSPADYAPQTQGQIWIAERKWCDLVFYHPELPLLTIRQYPDDDLIGVLKTQIPALLTERDLILSELNAMSNAA